MNDHEIVAAALRWHTAHERRMVIGAEQRSYQQDQLKRTGFGGACWDIGKRLTASKRIELAAMRTLAKACAKVRSDQQRVDNANVIDVPALLIYENQDGVHHEKKI